MLNKRNNGSSKSLNTGSTATPSVRSLAFMSELHLAEHDFENVFQTHDANFPLIESQHHGESLPATSHPTERDFQPQILREIKRGPHVLAYRFVRIEIRFVEQ